VWVAKRRNSCHSHSVGFSSGEYGGKNINSIVSCLARYSFTSFALCHLALSTQSVICEQLWYVLFIKSMVSIKFSAFPLVILWTMASFEFISTKPHRLTRSRVLSEDNWGWHPLGAHWAAIVGSNWMPASSEKRSTSSGSLF